MQLIKNFPNGHFNTMFMFTKMGQKV